MNLAEKLQSNLPADVLRLARELARLAWARKQRSAVVGGVVRDLLLDRPILDADLMLEPPAAPVVEEFSRAQGARFVAHARFLTFVLDFPSGRRMDVVTAREETYPAPGVLPVVTASSIEKDLTRRDFTINAIACFLHPDHVGDVLDPFRGRDDLRAGLVRALHAASFKDDPTRVFRAARFAGRLGFQVEEATKDWIAEAIRDGGPSRLSPARRRHEFEAILREPDPLPALRLVSEWGALEALHPEWARLDLSGLAPEIRAVDGSDRTDVLHRRLAIWFRLWPDERRNQILSDLGFEKAAKRRIQSLLSRASAS